MMKQTQSHPARGETTLPDSLRQDHAQGHTQVADDAASRGWTLNRVLLALSAAGPVLFLAVSVLLGLLDPESDVLTEPVSALAWGPLGWAQTANFYALGAATITFALGLYRSLVGRGRLGAAILLSISGLALITAGVFEGTPMRLVVPARIRDRSRPCCPPWLERTFAEGDHDDGGVESSLR
jgi:hypothetical protein